MNELKLTDKLIGHKGRVLSVRWHCKGNKLASSGEDKIIRIWTKNKSKWSIESELKDGHACMIKEVSWSPCDLIASVSEDGTMVVWSKATSGEFKKYTTSREPVTSASWALNSQLLTCHDKSLQVHLQNESSDEFERVFTVANSHKDVINKVQFHPHEESFATASDDKTAKVFDVCEDGISWRCGASLEGHRTPVRGVSFSGRGDRLVTWSDDRSIRLWRCYGPGNEAGVKTPGDRPVWRCVGSLDSPHSQSLRDVDLCERSDLIATASADGRIRVIRQRLNQFDDDLRLETLCRKDDAHDSGGVNCVHWSPRHVGELASAGDDGLVNIWSFHD